MTLIHHKFKCSSLVTTLLLTHTFIYIADIIETQHRVLVFSTRLSEVKKNEAIVSIFFRNYLERVKNMYAYVFFLNKMYLFL